MPNIHGMETRPLTIDYLQSQEYVIQFDNWAAKSLSGYSRRTFARWAKLSSPNFMTLVIQGKRSLQGEWLDGFIFAAKLNKIEEKYLRLLVLFEKSKNSNERSEILNQIHELLLGMKVKSLAYSQLEVLTQPAAWTVYHMLDLIDQNSSPLWIKQRLRFLELTVPEITKIFSLLKSLGLVSTKNGKLVANQKLIQSPNQVRKDANVIYHKYILEEAIRGIDVLQPEERAFGSMTGTIRREKLKDLKEEINRFGQHLLSKYGTSEPVEGEVMRVNIQLYPLTKKNEDNLK
jgi:uncharacterized protein (TIGR02147 family)